MMQNYDWWKEFLISVPRPIPSGMMVGMKGEVRDGKYYVVEFLEPVPEYQPNPFTRRTRATMQIADEDNGGDIVVSWSQEKGFTVLGGKAVQGTLW